MIWIISTFYTSEDGHMPNYSLPIYDKCREWIRTARANDMPWSAVYLCGRDNEAEREEYSNRSRAISDIGSVFDHDNNYLKLRRDEFDVLTGSHRKGWHNRPVAKSIQQLFDYYEQFSFDELTAMEKEMLESHRDSLSEVPAVLPANFSESELENMINYHDATAAQRITDTQIRKRVLHRGIIDQLKALYGYRCQICGAGFKDAYGVDIVEAHHIVPFSESLNNDASNLVILCPNHHRLIHAANAAFDRNSCAWDYHNGHIEPLVLNYHLE